MTGQMRMVLMLPARTSRCYVCDFAPYEKSARPRWFICRDCLEGASDLGVGIELVNLAGLLYREQKSLYG